MADDVVLYSVDDGVAVVTLNRPQRLNAWTAEMGRAYFDRLDQAVADPEVGAIVVTGAGRGFCSGADIDVLAERSASGPRVEADARPMHYPYRLPKLTIAAINGPAAGLGLVQSLYLDLRFAAEGAKLISAFPQRGLVAEYGSTWLLGRMVGSSRAFDILASSRVIGAEEAATLGLVNRVLPADQLLAAAMDYARHVIRACSPASVAAMKEQIHLDLSVDFDTSFARAARLMTEQFAGPDFAEGVASYQEKRPPRFAPLGQGTTFTF